MLCDLRPFGSPVSDDGCGLKLDARAINQPLDGGSPVSDDGCGLKLDARAINQPLDGGSPVSDDGCGLKHLTIKGCTKEVAVHPSAMTGAD